EWALTDAHSGVSTYEWPPDGSNLLLVMRDEEVEDSTWTSDEDEPWVIDRLQFNRDGTGYLTDPRKSHLYVFDVATRTTRQITAGDYDESAPARSPDGLWIAFV